MRTKVLYNIDIFNLGTFCVVLPGGHVILANLQVLELILLQSHTIACDASISHHLMLLVQQPYASHLHKVLVALSFLPNLKPSYKVSHSTGKNVTALLRVGSCVSQADTQSQTGSHGHRTQTLSRAPLPQPVIDLSCRCPPLHILPCHR